MKQPELGHKVLELRLSKGLTQAELAEQCNLSLRTIQRIEALEVTPRSYTIKTILSCLGYDLNEISQDIPSEKTGGKNRNDRIERSFKYVKELFNLKTNTMKKLSVLSVFAALMFAGIFFATTTGNAQSKKQLKEIEKTLTGVWQQVVLDPATGEIKTFIPYLKTFNADGTYTHMSMRAGEGSAFFNAVGKWKVIAEDKFLEYVEQSPYVAKRTEQQTFRIEHKANGTFMYSKFHTLGEDMEEISETWRKCDFSYQSLKKQ